MVFLWTGAWFSHGSGRGFPIVVAWFSHGPVHGFPMDQSTVFPLTNGGFKLRTLATTNRQHNRQETHAAVQEPTRTRRGSAWRSCQIPRERYSLAMPCPIKLTAEAPLYISNSGRLAHKISRRGALKSPTQAAWPIRFPAAAS